MKISVDGGALYPKNNRRFGSSVFSENLVQALNLYDKKNQYFIYTFKNLKPKLFWLKGRVSIEELKQKKDVFLALNQAIPFYTSGKIISFCHGLSYYFYPKYYPKKDYIRLKKQLDEMIKRSDKIIVSSEKVKDELVSIYQYIETKIIVLPFGIPLDLLNENFKLKISNFRNKEKYFLYVGMDHPIKNIDFIRKAFKKFKSSNDFKDYRLLLVTKNCSREKLKRLYQNATALLTSSHYESFNFPVLEALSQNCPVIGLKSAIIPELKQYVNVVGDEKQFVYLMNKAVNNKPEIKNRQIITKEFSWKDYVKNLVKLY
jgi:glycosyltransferase involved in cell wall biosynthesis